MAVKPFFQVIVFRLKFYGGSLVGGGRLVGEGLARRGPERRTNEERGTLIPPESGKAAGFSGPNTKLR